MSKQTLIVTQNLEESLIDQLQKAIPDWNIIVGRDQSVWEPQLKEAEIIAGWKKEMHELLDSQSKVKWIQSWSAGIDNLPLEVFKERHYHLTSATGVHANPISETIFALMLGLTRKVHTYSRQQQHKTWHHAGLKLEIHGKTLGLIGTGAIGKETAKIAKAFGMKVIGVRRSNKQEEHFDEIYTLSSLSDVLPELDYVVITLPHTKETNKLFGEKQFNDMKESAFLINIGRGEIVVEKDLIQALQDQKIAGAGLDVFEQEPLENHNPLWEMENVIITPHTAGATEHYNQRVVENILIPNLLNYVNGETPTVNLIDYEKGY
ncbi:D-2-hydroxyacid dehydrogenase [Jeotgalibacillus sp. S-D1]|uniref:D-2-hydroxyacid dehydrogenase n=1 Tax=Jeotgalibacillus sp. S-D1 TaxID=2552189 RepID=UPI001059A295|nr:D-2-hydroxyacid dehydrogenase [Jeotgalibacillus sp. S-D1]TDL31390.1 D-2-hydroxyacid dehydrogenase [Jeotgalibacillus sp. S-D1]